MSAQHTPGRLVEDTRGPRADIRSESGRIVAVTYGLGFPKTAEGLEKRTKEDRANRRRLVACWNACEGIDTEQLEIIADAGETFTTVRDRYIAQRDELLTALSRIAKWNEHTTEFAVDFGSNGVRDFYRGIASRAIRAIAKVKGGAA